MATQLSNNIVYDSNGRLVKQALVTVDDAVNPVFSTLQVTGLTASTALVSDATMHVISSTCTLAELAYVHGVTSAIQTQLDGKQASLGFTAVPTTRTVNTHALSADVTVTAADTGALALTGGTLSGDLTIYHTGVDSIIHVGAVAGAAQIIGDTSGDLKFEMDHANSVISFLPSNSGNASWFQANGSWSFGDTTLTASAVVGMYSTTRGFLPPKMTTAQRDAIGTTSTGTATVVAFGSLALATLTVNGTALIEGTNWTAAGSNNATATSLAAAVSGVSGFTGTANGAVVTIRALVVVGSSSDTLATSDNTNLHVSGATLTGEVDPAEGLQIWNSETHLPNFFDGTSWKAPVIA